MIDRDVLTVPTDEMKDVKVLQTFVEQAAGLWQGFCRPDSVTERHNFVAIWFRRRIQTNSFPSLNT